MMIKQTFLRSIVVGLFCLSSAAGADQFDVIKADLAKAKCTRFEFLSIIESEVFDQTDSSFGTAYVAHDGRFSVTIGADQYLFDGSNVYSYSAENNQVVIEKAARKEEISREISFITRLDEFYETRTIKPDSSYRLVKKADVTGDIPDSVTVFIARDSLHLERLEYYDINEERTVIVILEQQTDSVCSETLFEPAFPDSVEKVRL